MALHLELVAWAEPQLAVLKIEKKDFMPIVGDAGFRQYFRLHTTPALLAVYGPPDIEKHEQFTQISAHWRAHNINAPQVYAHDFDRGFLLIEDFGQHSLADQLQHCQTLADVAVAYSAPLQHLRALQTVPTTPFYPLYSADLLLQELHLFTEWFVAGLLNIVLTETEKNQLKGLFDAVVAQLSEQPNVIVHRDFHCRNIQVLADHNVGLIDFQDAVFGPITYDLVSLLKDCYQLWPKTFVQTEALNYRKTLPAHLAMASDAAFLEAFHLMGWQRHMKVLGIFSRLALRDNKRRYIDDLPRVIAYVGDAMSECPLLMPFKNWFDARIFSVAKTQPWFNSVTIQT
ncbi:MAG: phosphotransferase [Marinagarivorans sp.]|nr:phosphotransferase [Marinagarivorans sp.]